MKKLFLVLAILAGIGISNAKEKIRKVHVYKISQSAPFFKGKGNIQFVTVMGIIVYEMVMDGTTKGESAGATWPVQKSFYVDVPVSDLKNLKYYLKDILNPKPTPTPEPIDVR